MTSTGTRKPRDVQSRANDSIIENDKNFIANLKIFSGESEPVGGVAGQGSQSSPAAPAGNYLAREGDSMIGAIAFGPPEDFRVEIAADESINISPNLQNPQFSSNIELDAVQPNTFTLTRIDGAAFDGQILIIRTFGPDPFTISQATMANGGNIQTPEDTDFTLPALSLMYLVFDEALVVFSNTGGTWRVLPGTGGTGTGGDPTVLKNLDEVDLGDQSLQLISIDWQVANFYRWRATGDNQIQFTNEPAAGKWEPMIIQITQDGVGGHLQNWNDAPFANGTPIVDTNANAVSKFKFYNYFDGANNVIYWSFWDTQSNQTPWLSNIDANQFILFRLAEVGFTNAVPNGPLAGNTSIFWSNGSGNMVHQIRPGTDLQILQGDFDSVANTVATFNDSLIDFSIQTLPFTVFNAGDVLVKGISQFNNNMTLKTNNVAFPQPNFSPSNTVSGANDGGDLGLNTRYWNNLNVKQIRLRNGDVIIDIASIAYDSFFNGTIYNVPNGDSHLFKQFDGVSSTDTLFEINETEIDAWTKNIVNVVDPVQPQDAATKNYVDTLVGGTWKIPVRAKADGFTFLFPNIQSIIDGVTLAQGDRVLLTDELNGKNNGIWEVAGPFAGIPLQAPLIRPADFNSDSDMVSEVIVAVEEGDINKYSVWQLRTPNPIIDNVTSQDWGAIVGGAATNVILGVEDAPEFRWVDEDFEFFGNDGSTQENTVLGTTEPGSFTVEYTIGSSDFGSGYPGFAVEEYIAAISTTYENTSGANSASLSVKYFLNGAEQPNGTGFGIDPNNWGATLGMPYIAVTPGDKIQLKAWRSGGTGSITLRRNAIYTMPKKIRCTARRASLSVGPGPEDFTIFLAGEPTDYAVPIEEADQNLFFDMFYVGGNLNEYTFSRQYGDGCNHMIQGEFADNTDPDLDNDSRGGQSASERMFTPDIFAVNIYSYMP